MGDGDLERAVEALRRRVASREAQYAACVPAAREVVGIKYSEALAALHDVERALGLKRTPGKVLKPPTDAG